MLRGINVGGKRKILMADLRTMFTNLGYFAVETYIQSGNVAFENKTELDITAAEPQIEAAILKEFGHEVPVLIRSAGEMAASVAHNPFLSEKGIEMEQLHLTFLQKEPSAKVLQKLEGLDFGTDIFEIIGKDVFLCIKGSYHKTKLSNQFFEKQLGVRATTRNWKSVLKLLEMSK